ncbi:MAG: hypothetical protein DRR19_03165 [Candidatus Parabeggiatoa sp. nov. 1]|nr:MAG: hypothetical protein DRR19_03165 [Gammaproteobacteria bacterium]
MKLFNFRFKTHTLLGKAPQKQSFIGRKRFLILNQARKAFVKTKTMKFNNLFSKLFNFLFN